MAARAHGLRLRPRRCEAFTPEGTSQATTGASWRVDRRDRRRPPARAARPRSRCRAARRRSRPSPQPLGANGSGGRPGGARGWQRRRPELVESADASTSTSWPSSRSSRAATRPSPPLLPLPTTIRIGPSPRHGRRDAREARAPARSIRSSERHALLLDRPGVDGAHLGGLVERVEPVRKRAHRRIATAPAVVVGVRERDATLAAELRRPRGHRAAQPHLGRRAGGHHLHVAEAPARQPERLGHRLLGAEARRQVHRRPRPGRPRRRARRR